MQEHQKKILVVEDNDDIRSLESRILRADGYEVLSASNLDDAFTILKEHHIDLVLLDIVLEDQSGLDILTEMRMGSNRKLRRIPVIMLTSKSTVEDIAYALALGADSYLVKPFRGRVLTERVHSILDQLISA